MKIALRTMTGNYVTAVNDGGMGDPSGMPFNSTPIHTNAPAAATCETFIIEPAGKGKHAFKTRSGNYVTAVKGGGIGDPPGFALNTTAVHTNATEIGPWETFTVVPSGAGYALQTGKGTFVSAVKDGDMGDPAGQPFNSWPIHTNATQIGQWENFEIVVVEM